MYTKEDFERYEKICENLKFYILIDDFNRKTLEEYNIFQNVNMCQFIDEYEKEYKKDKDREKFLYELDRILKYSFWSKCEYEVEIGDLFDTYVKKVDVYQRVKPNINIIADLIINYWER